MRRKRGFYEILFVAWFIVFFSIIMYADIVPLSDNNVIYNFFQLICYFSIFIQGFHLIKSLFIFRKINWNFAKYRLLVIVAASVALKIADNYVR
jgi:hypothetical protein